MVLSTNSDIVLNRFNLKKKGEIILINFVGSEHVALKSLVFFNAEVTVSQT